MIQDDKPIEKKIFDIVLAARTEGIVGGKTKWLAKGDTDDILNIFLTDDVCRECKGGKYVYPSKLRTTCGITYCPTCDCIMKKSKTIRQVIEEYYADS